MATWKSVTLLILIAKSIIGFNVGRTTRPRSSAVMPPLFYTDVEPEISSITITPPVINGATSIFVDERLAFDKVATKRRQATKPIEVKVSRKTSPTTSSSLSTTIASDRFATKRKQHNTSLEVKVSRPETMTRPKPDDDNVSDASDMMPKSYKPHKTVWLTRYNELKAYKSQKGHCMLPQSYAPNPKLGLWVMQQRRQYTLQQRGKNSSFDGPNGVKRIRLLEDIGFVWRVERGGPRGSYKSLRRMKYHAESNVDIEDEITDVVDFESYMVGKSREYSDEEMREAWRHRFAFFR